MKRTLPFYSDHSSFSGKKIRSGVSPSDYVIRNIMNYSRALEVLKTEKTGIVNVIVN
jgi:hypothetical protein